jgi:hypothetical protein
LTERHPAIYALVDPRDGALRYIGVTKGPVLFRVDRHYHDSRVKTPVGGWVFELRRAGYRPDWFVVEYADGFAWRDAESFWIGYFRMIGADLLNVQAGGDSRRRLRKTLTDDERLSARYGIPVSEIGGKSV